MKADERRTKIVKDIRRSKTPLSATQLAEKYGVSRQIIVGDIAILRAAGENIYATPKGYCIEASPMGLTRTVACIHTTTDEMHDEMNLCVDNGCEILNVIVEHPVYGQLQGQLNCSSRYDVEEFLKKVAASDAAPLSELTDGIHLHTLLCPSEEAFERVKALLAKRGLLYEA